MTLSELKNKILMLEKVSIQKRLLWVSEIRYADDIDYKGSDKEIFLQARESSRKNLIELNNDLPDKMKLEE